MAATKTDNRQLVLRCFALDGATDSLAHVVVHVEVVLFAAVLLGLPHDVVFGSEFEIDRREPTADQQTITMTIAAVRGDTAAESRVSSAQLSISDNSLGPVILS